MTDPLHTTVGAVSLVTLAVAFFGPQVGPYVVIVMGSVAGGLWALSSTALATRVQGLGLMVRCVLTAVVLTALIAEGVSPYIHTQIVEAYAVVAFAIGAFGNRWEAVFDAIKRRVMKFIASGSSP